MTMAGELDRVAQGTKARRRNVEVDVASRATLRRGCETYRASPAKRRQSKRPPDASQTRVPDSHPKCPLKACAPCHRPVRRRMVARPTPKSERYPPHGRRLEDQSPRPVWLDLRRAGAEMEGSGGKRKILSGGKKHTFFGSCVVFEGGGSLSFLPRPRLVHDRHPPPVPRGVSSSLNSTSLAAMYLSC